MATQISQQANRWHRSPWRAAGIGSSCSGSGDSYSPLPPDCLIVDMEKAEEAEEEQLQQLQQQQQQQQKQPQLPQQQKKLENGCPRQKHPQQPQPQQQQQQQQHLHQLNGSSGVAISYSNGDCHNDDSEDCKPTEDDDKIPPAERWKTAVALAFMLTGMSLTGVSLTFVHERVPLAAPLPDVMLSRVTHVPWALDVCEYLLLASMVATYITACVHKHRWIVLRRIFFIIGVLFAYRSVTIFVTALPNPSPTYYCEPKLSQGLGVKEVLARVLRLAKGGGFSINGNHVYCGDYIFSGHTAILTLSYLAIKEYTSPRLSVLHWTSWFVSLAGVAFLVLSHGHYTIDILLGYWVTSRLWWMYHTAANFAGQRTHGYFRGACWWPIFAFFEANTRCGPLPYQFELPIPWLVWPAAGASCGSPPLLSRALGGSGGIQWQQWQWLSQCKHRAIDWCRRLLTLT